MALGVARVVNGLPLYPRPDFHFIPYMYSPAYFWVSGWAAKLLGPGLVPLRLVSILSTIGSFALIALQVFAETGNRLAALVGAGLYASAYPASLYFFDLGRVDSLYVFLVLLALVATRWLNPVSAALAWTLAFLAKQSVIPVAVAALCLDWRRPRRVLAGLGTFALASFGSTAWLDHVTNGWFRYYVFTVPGANSNLRLHYAANILVRLAPFSVALTVVAAALLLTGVHWSDRTARFYLGTGATLVLLVWFLGFHAGSVANVAMPLYALLAVAFGIALARLTHWLHGLPVTWSQAGLTLLLLAACAQFACQARPSMYLIPSPAMRASQQQFEDWLQSVHGDVLVVAHPYESVMAGKPAHPDEFAIRDALGPGMPAVNVPLLNEIRQAVEQQTLEAIVIDSTPREEIDRAPWLPADLLERYPIVGIVPGSDSPRDPGSLLNPDLRFVLLPCSASGVAAAQSIAIISSPGVATCGAMHPR
ncbi:MAG: hypothetical protein P4L26_11390 [Terracidiphilus sp.]|nr:hypothetical protein [Terracidiphilus sp.]